LSVTSSRSARGRSTPDLTLPALQAGDIRAWRIDPDPAGKEAGGLTYVSSFALE
jgi:hypothetical protein